MSMRIAIFENDDVIGAAVATLAYDEGWTVSGSRYLDASLTRLKEFEPDLIVLDFDIFRVGGGWEFLQLLKMEEETSSIPTVIVAGSFDLPREVKGYLGSRQINLLSKPLNPEDFLFIARQLLAGPQPLRVTGVEQMPILVVEGNIALAEAFIEILQLEGYLATTVPNGQLALDALRSGEHSLIFLDMNMPVMNGMEFIAAYALQPKPHTPVVIFSAYDTDTANEQFPYFVIGRLPNDFMVSELFVFVARYAAMA